MSFPRYPKYKASGVEWLGEVPEHWGISRLGFESWVRARLGWKGLKSEEYVDDGFAFLSTPNIKGLSIDFENVNFISQERFDESPEIKVREGDVLLAKDGSTLGTVNVIRQLPRPTTVNSSIAVITPNSSLNGVFLYYLLASSYMKQTIQRTKGGMGVPHLFQADLNKFYLPLPPLPEQTAIAAFLDRETGKIDALVAEQRRLMELLKEKRQAVISHAVTRGLNPAAPLKDSGIDWLGQVPAHWEVGPLKRYWSVTDCKHVTAEFVEEGIPLASIREVQSRWVALENAKCTTEHFYELLIEGERCPKAGDLIFSRNATVGEVAQVHANHPRFAMGQDVVLLRKLSQSYSSDYLQHVIRSPIIIQQLANLMIGSTFKRINVEEIRSFVVPMPPENEQAGIAAYLEKELASFDALTAEAQRAIDLLQERRTALISAAVTGQIDVRT
jgi:type I restriction enzyme, S subunit